MTNIQPPIPEGEMLALQEKWDQYGMNLKGSDRFFNTIQHYLNTAVRADAYPPPCDVLYIRLNDTVALEITAETVDDDGSTSACLDLRFVPISVME